MVRFWRFGAGLGRKSRMVSFGCGPMLPFGATPDNQLLSLTDDCCKLLTEASAFSACLKVSHEVVEDIASALRPTFATLVP